MLIYLSSNSPVLVVDFTAGAILYSTNRFEKVILGLQKGVCPDYFPQIILNADVPFFLIAIAIDTKITG